MNAEAFAILPLESQIDYLSRSLSTSNHRDLIALCAPLRDPAPLAWLCRRFLETGWLRDELNRAWFARFMVSCQETTIHKILSSLTEPPIPESEKEALCQTFRAALLAAPIEALAGICLVDRSFRRNFAEEREAFISNLVDECERAIASGRLQSLELGLLAQLPSSAVHRLQSAAAGAGQATAVALEEVRKHLAREAINVLGNAPKAVSQANAEDLLARRVYTDPGHFLIELLQNAEDAGARKWHVRFDAHQIVVWHDGMVFDTRDVVGVTSIGQTTKRKQQIGFFGVGFKAVYEVTDRPQIYSDIWAFEIADVSIPKVLGGRPANVRPDGTVLILPLKRQLDGERSPRALFQKAAALDACVLLTLRSIDEIRLELTAAAGGPAEHCLIEGVRDERSSIKFEPSGKLRSYLIRDDEFLYESGDREAGRPDRSKVMVGILFDENERKPVCLEDSAATVYSYLPTRESPGLRFFVQGHFDVPLDRERIAPDSLWNRWILTKVPVQLARIASKLSANNDRVGAVGLLDVLPLRAELPAPPFSSIVDGLPAALADIAFLPAASGGLCSAKQALLPTREISQLLNPEDAVNDSVLLHLDVLDRRRSDVALSLGAKNFGTPEFLSYLEQQLAGSANAQSINDVGVSCLRKIENFPVLFDILLTEAERLERAGLTQEHKQWLERIKKLPLIPDENACLQPASRLVRGTDAFRRIYKDVRKFVHPQLDQADAGRSRVLFDKLAIVVVNENYLLNHLEQCVSVINPPLKSPTQLGFPSIETRLPEILTVLASADWEMQKRAVALPLFLATDGLYWRAAHSASDMRGVLRVSFDSNGERLSKLYGTLRPLSAAAPGDPAAVLLERVSVAQLDITVLAADLSADLFSRSASTLRQVHHLFNDMRDEISDKLVKQLADMPIWLDRQGRARPLSGIGRVLIPQSDEICDFFPKASFLESELCGLAYVQNLAFPKIDVAEVVAALLPEATAPLRIEITGPSAEKSAQAILRFILKRAGNVDATTRKNLLRAPVFCSDRGKVMSLSQLRLACDPELRSLYGDWEASHFISPEGLTIDVIRAVGIEQLVVTAQVLELIRDLSIAGDSAHEIFKDPAPLIKYVADRVQNIPAAQLIEFTRLHIFSDVEGKRGRLPVVGTKLLEAQVLPVAPDLRDIFVAVGGRRILDSEQQSSLSRILQSVNTPALELDDLIQLVAGAKSLPEGLLVPLQTLLVNRRWELTRLFPPDTLPGGNTANRTVNALAIWRSVSGSLVSAADVVEHGNRDLLEPGSEARKKLDRVSLDSEAEERLCKLIPVVCPKKFATFMAELVIDEALDGQPIAKQPSFLNSIEKVSAVCAELAQEKDSVLPRVDATETLTFNNLFYADAVTHELVAGLPIQHELLHPKFLAVDKVGTSDSEQEKKENALLKIFKKLTLSQPATESSTVDKSVPPVRVLSALGKELSSSRSRAFYRWLEEHSREVFQSKQALQLLSEGHYFKTMGGAMVPPQELILEADLPDIGLDWLPSPEIPASVLALLERYLDIGRPNLDELVRTHVVPAYLKAVREQDLERAGALIAWLSKRLSGRHPSQLRELIFNSAPVSAEFLIECEDGKLAPFAEVICSPPRLSETLKLIWPEGLRYLSKSRYAEQVRRFLLDLGLSTFPPMPLIAATLAKPLSLKAHVALVELIGYLREIHGKKVFEDLPLMTTPWLLDGTGARRLASELFLNRFDLEQVAGNFPDLYLRSGLEELLGETLVTELKFRAPATLSAEEVKRHIQSRVDSDRAVPLVVYAWLDQGVRARRFSASRLHSAFDGISWICTDDGQYFPHTKVIGCRAFSLFGSRRGYWEIGARECPDLCKAMGIPFEPSADVVATFVEEIGAEVAQVGSKKVLQSDKALPHMLLGCFALLGFAGRTVDKSLPIIPATGKDSSELMPAQAPNLFWSDTPTLDALFYGAGPLFLAWRGKGEEVQGVLKFLSIMGVRRLRDALKIVPDVLVGKDRSEDFASSIAELRQTLRALHSVLARVEVGRPVPPPSRWVYNKFLKDLFNRGGVRVIDGLKVAYVLPGVGEVHSERPCIYNHDTGELLIDVKVMNDPSLTGLAEGLIESIIEGPMSDIFVDLVEMLLAQRSRDKMNEYLNRRHFATASDNLSNEERIKVRVEEILDYGLDEHLRKRFPALADAEFQNWRDPDLLAPLDGINSDDLDACAKSGATILVNALNLSSVPSPDVMTMLESVLLAPTLSSASAMLVVVRKDDDGNGGKSALDGNAVIPMPGAKNSSLLSIKPEGMKSQRDLTASWRESFGGNAEHLRKTLTVVGPVAGGVVATIFLFYFLLTVKTGGAVASSGSLLPLFLVLFGVCSVFALAFVFVTQNASRGASADPSKIAGSSASSVLNKLGFDDHSGGKSGNQKRDNNATIENLLAGYEHAKNQPQKVKPNPKKETERVSKEKAANTPSPKPFERAPKDPPKPAKDTVVSGSEKSARQNSVPGSGSGDFRSMEKDLIARAASNLGSSASEFLSLPTWAAGNAFSPGNSIKSQLWATRENRERVKSVRYAQQLAFSPGRLPTPYLYAIHELGTTFNPRRQTWDVEPSCLELLKTPGRSWGRTVVFEGTVAAGESQLPMPLYGKLKSIEALQGKLQSYEEKHTTLVVHIGGRESARIRYEVDLLDPPELKGQTAQQPLPRSLQPLLAVTTPTMDLPERMRDWIDYAANSTQSLLDKALAAQAFVRRFYIYDDDFMSSSSVKSVLKNLKNGAGNHHLQIAHAAGGGDDQVLGRGICYELNVILVELLRHIGVPALVATCWVLDEGVIDIPEHLCALAVLPSDNGYCLFPLDAAATEQGPVRSLGRRRHESTGQVPAALPSLPAPKVNGVWDIMPAARAQANGSEVHDGITTYLPADKMPREEINLLKDAVRRVRYVMNSKSAYVSEDPRELRRELDDLLGQKAVVDAFLAILRGDLYQAESVPPAVKELVEIHLVRIETVPSFHMLPNELD